MTTAQLSRRAGLLGLTALLAAGAACGGSGGSGADQKTGMAARIVTTTTLAPTTTTTAAKPAANFDDLSRLLLASVPAAYKVQPNDVGDTGPSNFEKAVSDDGGDDARAVLKKAGFVRGYQRLWQMSDDEDVVAFLYQFNDHAGAVDYGKRTTDDMAKGAEGVTLTSFDVPGIEGEVAMSGHNAEYASSVVVFTKGPYLMQLVVEGPTPAGLPDLAKTLAADQFARL
jgi:hypothetical protein